ncbi:MAG TPA: serine hydrolase domain-containing protein [Candidatus Polarisedimenticolaceae bacterium]
MSSDPLRAFVEAEVSAGSMPGACWHVESSGKTLARGAAGSVTFETPFDLASLTKPLATALLAALAEHRGAIDLSAPAGAWLPELSGSAWERATLLDLGAHRAGLPPWRPLYLSGSTREAYLAAIAAEPAAAPPGTTLYSDLGYILLGIAIERALGRPLDVLFDVRIAATLGLARAGYAGTSDRFEDAAPTERGNAFERELAGEAGHDHPFRTEVIRGAVHDGNAWGLGGVAGHAGLFATADAVAAIARHVLDSPARRRMLAPVAGEGTRSFGFTFAPLTESVRGVLDDDAVGHFGFTGTSVWIEPRVPRIYVLLTNRVHPTVPRAEFSRVRQTFHRVAQRCSNST